MFVNEQLFFKFKLEISLSKLDSEIYTEHARGVSGYARQ